ncbi:MAG: methyl-accepting chemotaxis protein [Alphaproteobacteria bacterium]
MLGGVALLGLNGLTNAESGLDEFSRMSKNAIRVCSIDRNVVGLRRNVAVFATSADEKAITRVKELETTLRRDLKDAAEGTTNAERRANLKKMAEIFEGYIVNFAKVVELRKKSDKVLAEVIDPTGSDIRKTLTSLIDETIEAKDWQSGALAGKVQEQIGLARLNARRFVADPEQKQVDTVKEQFGTAKKTLAEMIKTEDDEKHRGRLEAVLPMVSKYEAAFLEMSGATLERDKLVKETMAAQAQEIAKLSAATFESQMKRMEETMASTDEEMAATSRETIGLSIGAAVLGLLFAWLIASGVTNPVKAMTDAMTRLAGGDKSLTVPALDNKDEIGAMAKAVQVFKENAIKVDRMTAEAEEQKKQAEIEKRRAMNQLADNFESSVKGVVNGVASAATEMQSTAESMSAISEETSRQSTAVAAASEQASANVQTVSAAAEELSSSINEISRQVATAAKISASAVDQARHTNEIVQGLATAAGRIGEVVDLINDIAAQTNLLALNATIEAARAGEAGKGFAVVANEVKSLANQTGKATEEISQQIGAVQNSTREAVAAIQAIGGTISEISEISSTIASAVEEQGAATKEIARNVDQAAAGTQDVSRNISGVTQAAEEAGQSANQVLVAAGELSRQAETLRGEVNGFISRVRAA